VVAEAVVPELDACAALRADLAARDGSAPNGLPAGPAAAAASPELGDVHSAAWLPLVVGLERAARLARRGLPAHFRRQQAAWDAAAAAFGEARYARVGRRLARWRSADPGLRLVEELLWALEQPEAAGYTRLALAGVTALGALVPADDVRAGYVLAQSARAVRTLGDSTSAVDRYIESGRIGRRQSNERLRARSAIGLGTTYLHFGNHPAARTVFRSVLETKVASPELTAAARQGLLNGAVAAEDWDSALREGWYLLRAEQFGAIARVEVLNIMADVCQRIGCYQAATHAAEVAMRVAVRPSHAMVSLAILVGVATRTQDRALGLRYAPTLRTHIGKSAGPFEDSRALLTLAQFEAINGLDRLAVGDLAAARAIAHRYRYHELQFQADYLAEQLTARKSTKRVICSGEDEITSVVLDSYSQDIVSRMDDLREQDFVGYAVPAYESGR
jgi:hypothetical protein